MQDIASRWTFSYKYRHGGFPSRVCLDNTRDLLLFPASLFFTLWQSPSRYSHATDDILHPRAFFVALANVSCRRSRYQSLSSPDELSGDRKLNSKPRVGLVSRYETSVSKLDHPWKFREVVSPPACIQLPLPSSCVYIYCGPRHRFKLFRNFERNGPRGARTLTTEEPASK